MPKKPHRQSNIRDDREPTPDYDSSGGKNNDKSPLATSPVKKSGGNEKEQNKALDNLNQTRGKNSKTKFIRPTYFFLYYILHHSVGDWDTHF